MARRSWWDEHREQVGEWATGLEILARRYVDKHTYLRRVGDYTLWRLERGHDPTEADYDRVTEHLGAARRVSDGEPLNHDNKADARSCINSWHAWLRQ